MIGISIPVRTNKAVVVDGDFELAQLRHALGGIDPGQTGEPVRVFVANIADILIRDVMRPLDVEVATSMRDEQRAFDARLIHHLEIILDFDSGLGIASHAHLVFEIFVDPHQSLIDHPRSERVADDIDITTHDEMSCWVGAWVSGRKMIGTKDFGTSALSLPFVQHLGPRQRPSEGAVPRMCHLRGFYSVQA
jgi:hypothetical protein